MQVVAEQSYAERARSVLTDARTATLVTGTPCSPRTRTTVVVEDQGDGLPLVWLDAAEPAVAGLAACRVATLTVVDPATGQSVRMVVSLRMRRPDDTGRRAYEPTLLSVRTSAPRAAAPVTIPVDAFLRVQGDPGRVRRRALLDHLESEHGDDLLARVRAEGHDADVVVPRALHRYGLELTLLGLDGVSRLRLAYAGEPGEQDADKHPVLTLETICGCTPS